MMRYTLWPHPDSIAWAWWARSLPRFVKRWLAREEIGYSPSLRAVERAQMIVDRMMQEIERS